MEFGLIFPTSDLPDDAIAIRDFVQAAEGLGYDSLLTYDHVLGAEHARRSPPLMGPYDETFPIHEPLVLLGYLAGVTRSIELSTGVLVLPQRQTALVAKQAAEIQILSGGRLRLGVGSGWNHVEFSALGGDWRGRGRMLDEQVQLLRRLWSSPVIDYRGDFHRIDRAGINPLPGPTIPIWFGGASRRAYARAARLGDGFVFRPDDRDHSSALRWIHAERAHNGRASSAFGSECAVSYGLGPEHWVSMLERWREAGGTRLSLQAFDFGYEKLGAIPSGARSLEERIAILADFIDVVRSACAE